MLLSSTGSSSGSEILVKTHDITACSIAVMFFFLFFLFSIVNPYLILLLLDYSIFIIYPLLILLHVMSLKYFDIASQPPFVVLKPPHLLDREPNSGDQTLSLHLAEYILL